MSKKTDSKLDLSQFADQFPEAKGGIKIKKSHKGLFTKKAKAAGMGVQEYASKILANKDKHSGTLVKQASFAHTFGGRHYDDGGDLEGEQYYNQVGEYGAYGINMPGDPIQPIQNPTMGPVAPVNVPTAAFGPSPYDKLYANTPVDVQDYNTGLGKQFLGAAPLLPFLADTIGNRFANSPQSTRNRFPMQETYNPYKYGTGSQAIFEDGGDMQGGLYPQGGNISIGNGVPQPTYHEGLPKDGKFDDYSSYYFKNIKGNYSPTERQRIANVLALSKTLNVPSSSISTLTNSQDFGPRDIRYRNYIVNNGNGQQIYRQVNNLDNAGASTVEAAPIDERGKVAYNSPIKEYGGHLHYDLAAGPPYMEYYEEGGHISENLIPFTKNGGSLSSSKAKEILRDGTAQGHPLTEKQKRYFGFIAGGGTPKAKVGRNLSREEDYGSKKKPYPMVDSSDFAGPHRSYPIPSRSNAVDALRLAGLHHNESVKAKVYAKYPDLKKPNGGEVTDYAHSAGTIGYTNPYQGIINAHSYELSPQGLPTERLAPVTITGRDEFSNIPAISVEERNKARDINRAEGKNAAYNYLNNQAYYDFSDKAAKAMRDVMFTGTSLMGPMDEIANEVSPLTASGHFVRDLYRDSLLDRKNGGPVSIYPEFPNDWKHEIYDGASIRYGENGVNITSQDYDPLKGLSEEPIQYIGPRKKYGRGVNFLGMNFFGNGPYQNQMEQYDTGKLPFQQLSPYDQNQVALDNVMGNPNIPKGKAGKKVMGRKMMQAQPAQQQSMQNRQVNQIEQTVADELSKGQNPQMVMQSLMKQGMNEQQASQIVSSVEQRMEQSQGNGQQQEQEQTMNMGGGLYSKGGSLYQAKSGIHINPANRGKFTSTKKRTGKSTEELTHSKNPLTRKRAIFAQNSRSWRKGDSGFSLNNGEYDLSEEEINDLMDQGYNIQYLK